MSVSLGFKRTVKTVLQFPALILTPAFSYWTFGPVNTFSASTWCCGGSQRLGVSFLHTWINFAITLLGQLCYAITIESRDEIGIAIGIGILPFHVLNIILLILIQSLHRCKCCACCNSDTCNSITERTLLDVDHPLEQIFFDEQKNNKCENDIEMIEVTEKMPSFENVEAGESLYPYES